VAVVVPMMMMVSPPAVNPAGSPKAVFAAVPAAVPEMGAGESHRFNNGGFIDRRSQRASGTCDAGMAWQCAC
jgi:hypothetical protein